MIDRSKVYQLLRQIPKGKVTTYSEIARQLNSKGYRQVGKIIGMNRDIPGTPCHRVVKSDGTIGGYAFGVDKKVSILKSEGVEVDNGKIINFANKIYNY